MGLLDDVRDLFPHEITIEEWTGDDRKGPTYGTAKTYHAKIERGSRQVFSTGGDRGIAPKHKVFIAAPVNVDVRDRVTLPTEFGERNASGIFEPPTPIIREAVPVYDGTEQVCTILYCG